MAEKEPVTSEKEPTASQIKLPGMEDFDRRELARAYVPVQVYSMIWSPAEGLQRGTIFPELYRPYVPGMRG